MRRLVRLGGGHAHVKRLDNQAERPLAGGSVTLTCGATKRDFDCTLAMPPTAADEPVLMRDPGAAARRGGARVAVTLRR